MPAELVNNQAYTGNKPRALIHHVVVLFPKESRDEKESQQRNSSKNEECLYHSSKDKGDER